MRRRWLGWWGAALLVLTAVPTTSGAQQGEGPQRRRPDSTASSASRAAPGAPIRGQPRARRCSQVLPSDARQIVNLLGQEVVYFRDPVRMVCTGGMILEADSAVLNRTASSVELVGHVLYRDSTRQLVADWANYLGQPDQLIARGAVELTDNEDGARVTGENLDFRPENETRPEAYTRIVGGRPHATLPPAAREEGAAPPDSAAPIEVWADQLTFLGQTVFDAVGSAEFERGDMQGAADSMRYDQGLERLSLTGQGHVENDQYRLEADRINALIPGDTLREVNAAGASRLITTDLRVQSERIRIGMVAGELDRLEAWNPAGIAAYRPPPAPPEPDSTAVGGAEVDGAGIEEAEVEEAELAAVEPEAEPAPAAQDTTTGAAEREPRTESTDPAPEPTESGTQPDEPLDAPVPPRAVAASADFTLRADSIDARADSGQIREVRAVSRAFGERQIDTLAVPGSAVVTRDWIQGDTIVGYFTTQTVAAEAEQRAASLVEQDARPDVTVDEGARIPRPPTEPGGRAESDSTGVVLERIVVVGGTQPALSLYRRAPEEPGGDPAINFMRAARIVLFLSAGDLDRVEADGPISGMYLEPTAARPQADEEEPQEGEAGG